MSYFKIRYAGGILLLCVLSILLAPQARADWIVGDPYKMHYPQLPDPNGWDVNFTAPAVLADDWRCSETGPVSDIHFWISFRGDQADPGLINSIHASIHSDVPADPVNTYSHPGDLLWEYDFNPNLFTIAGPFTGQQGWYDPVSGDFAHPDHLLYWQVNITNIPDAFVQQQGTIYWLDLSLSLATSGVNVGWKTSQDHFNDDAVVAVKLPGDANGDGVVNLADLQILGDNWMAGGAAWAQGDFTGDGLVNLADLQILGDNWGASGPLWKDLHDPITGESLDLAFVITPEPSSLVLLALSGAAMLRRRR
ncbi:MAG: PEP-CTERM sorting domain-containing protein [Phycisphaeraceae bacterium]|nr:PEP-CTERM sorting domain-containing protein [Phycisphaeraceae bacterium]